MQAIIDAFDFIINTIKSVWDFFTGFLENTVKMLDILSSVADITYGMIASLPTWLTSFATITIFVSLLFMILNRQGGGE